jgi:hypothetical protein
MDLFIIPDDLSLTIPEEQTEYTTRYSVVNLLDHAGDQLVDNNGNLLTATIATDENVHVLHVKPDELTLTIPEET